MMFRGGAKKDAALTVSPMSPLSSVDQPRHVVTRRYDVQAHYEAVRNSVAQLEAETWTEMMKVFTADRRDIEKYDDSQRERRRKEAIQRAGQANRSRFTTAVRIEEMFEEELRRRTNRLIQEERLWKAILALYRQALAQVEHNEALRKLVSAEQAKRYCIEKHEQSGTSVIAQRFVQVPWKPVLNVLGTCPFHSKGHCPFSSGLCHGLNVPAAHFALAAARRSTGEAEDGDAPSLDAVILEEAAKSPRSIRSLQ